MGNKFDMISANPSGSINNLNLLNETFHVFSKSPASDVTTLGGARLKSGHTTTTSDVWADEIPAFFSAANQAKFDLFSTLAVKDDLCIFGGKVYQHNGEQFVSLGTEAEILVDGATFQKNNKDVIKYHKNRTAINLTADNNNGDGSNNLTAKIYDAATGSTNFVSQFISSTDKIVAGVPSLAYDATVIAGGVKLAEGLTNDNDYICNSYAGVIQFNKARSQGSVTVSAWEYIGGILSDSIKFNEDELKKHKEELTAKNKSIHVNDTDRDKWDAAAAKAATAVQNVTSGNAYLERGTDDDNITLTLKVDTNLNDGGTANSVPSSAAVTNYGSSIISTHEAKKDGNKNIHVTASERSSWDTAATKAGTAVQTVKRADNSSTLISVNQSGTTVSIGLSNTVATKTDISSLEDKITDKTVRINAGTNNITAELTENENAADSYTISVDGYTTEEVDSLLKTKADEKLLENTIGKVSEITKNLQDVESNLLKHTSNTDEDALHVTQAEKDIWNAGGNALQEIIEGDHIEVNGNTVGVNTTSLVADTIFTTKVNELIGEGLSTVEESIDDINNELETYNYSIAQSIETGTASGTNNTRGFGTLITNDITLGKVITYCHSTGGAENSNIWLKVFESSSPNIFKGISDTSLNHKHGATLEYTFKNSDIKLEANKEYFFVFCPENQKNSTTFQNSTDSVDCCIQTVTNTTGYGGVCGPTGISNDDYIALHKIYKKPGKFAFTADLEEETTRATQREEELENLIKNKVEALPSVYTGDNMFYTNCYGFEYTNPSENIIFDKIEIKFAKNLDTLTKYKPQNAPEINPLEIENDICKIVVAKVKTPAPGVYEQPPASDEIEIATSSYNTNISKEVNLSQFKFSENIILEGGWNYRFYFYDKNGSLFPASVIINYVPVGDTTLKQSSVANRYLSDRYDYWGVHGPEQDNNTKVLNGLGLKLINSVQEHVNNKDIHVTLDDKNNWNASNIEYKALNKDVSSYKDGVLTYGDGTTENINLEKTISAQYAFGKYSSSSANTISEFNLRTIKDNYTRNDGANYENDCVVSDDEAVNTLANLINGRGMFLRSRLTTFNDELPCLMLGDVMFKDSKSLSNFRSPLPSLTCASGMFRGCTSLTTFRTKLPSLSRAKSMFNDDSELTIVDTCLPNLTYGNNMFSNCPKLTVVNLSSTSLNNLYDGTFMFHCNTTRDFNKFRGDLSSLETAEYMFTGCRLDLESVTRIADTIRDWSGDNSSPCEHRIGIGINSKSNWTNWSEFEEQKTRITNKGWTIAQWQENGVDPEPAESAALTYYYAKPASGYASPEYIDENGNKVTLILTHYTDCKDEYEIVSSREEAEIRFNLTKIETSEESSDEVI